jgi:glycosyltransferase involved in cell wall biosynthesis
MKINYITNVRIPTSRAQGYAIMKMCEEFAKSGEEVELIIPKRRSNVEDKDPFSYYGIDPVFKIKRIFGFDFLGMSEKFGKLTFWLDTILFLFMVRLKGLTKPGSIIYTRDYMLALFIPKKSFLSLELHDIPGPKSLFRRAVNKANVIFVLNSYIKEELLKLGVSESKIFIEASGVDLERFDVKVDKSEVKKKLELPLNKKIVMYIGLLDKWKGVETLLKASRFLKDAQVVIIGEGSELARFKKEYPGVIYKGSLPYRDLPFNQQGADVLVAPNSEGSNISNLYTSPLKVIAYMTSGIPIVASDLPSIREVLNESNAYLVEPDNPKALAEGIKKALTEDGKGKTMKALEDVGKYSWDKRVKSILSIIKYNLNNGRE